MGVWAFCNFAAAFPDTVSHKKHCLKLRESLMPGQTRVYVLSRRFSMLSCFHCLRNMLDSKLGRCDAVCALECSFEIAPLAVPQIGRNLLNGHASHRQQTPGNFHFYLKALRPERNSSLLLKSSIKIAGTPAKKFCDLRFADVPVAFLHPF